MEPKPFTPEEARQIVESLEQPAVFLGMTGGWPALRWTAEHLADVLGEKTVRFRVGKMQDDSKPLFETQCSYVEATVWEFLSWTKGQGPCPGPFSDFPRSKYWAYADYKYIAVLFQHKPAVFQDVLWSDFGYPGRNGQESTLWVGTDGANTPCHQDTYGCNLVLQVQGRKKWHLFPEGDTCCLYPTRIPYEESSIFSQVDVTRPDLRRFPAFAGARAHVVTLQPGQVLFVPRHWWHYVESLDPVTVSINSWIEMVRTAPRRHMPAFTLPWLDAKCKEADDTARVGEALTRTIVCALKTLPNPDNLDEWLNPTETSSITKNRSTEDGKNPRMLVLLCMEYQGYIDYILTKRDESHDSLRPKFVLASLAAALMLANCSNVDLCVALNVPGALPQVDVPSHGENLRDLSLAVQACATRQSGDTQGPPACGSSQPMKRDARGEPKHSAPPAGPVQHCRPDVIPFGPHLVLVAQENAYAPLDEEVQGADEKTDRLADVTGHRSLSTNDLLEVLVHPDVIALAAKLLVGRHGCG